MVPYPTVLTEGVFESSVNKGLSLGLTGFYFFLSLILPSLLGFLEVPLPNRALMA